ncbi:universal stress protein UspA [Duganella caerulea]|uniref:universal stress protein n=1 Tax=Duganella caerulea TaxID=2885762 RepID=UPI0030E93715
MGQHILLPTDGSALSRKTIDAAMALAKRLGARVHGLYVVPLLHPDYLDAFAYRDPGFVQRQKALFEHFADEYLAVVRDAAQTAGVPCVCSKAYGADPAVCIVSSAHQFACDMIYMASHGWSEDQPLGSVTAKVLRLSHVPVVVYKPAPAERG